ncbi:dynein axonemal assembly factor 1-like [Clytia hemisphaerica]|uniref:Dynein assembly factor 1, axonemal homolog n=1 Tax=Clytia hemisphaerica TaxID=252671 RepID=A0A7M5V513_9CNID|eukprot:TCONS_00023044-protein
MVAQTLLNLSDKKDENSEPRMTPKVLKQICKTLKLYQTPYLNDVLYLHYKGFSKIESLDEYTGLKCLWLECNGITAIENIAHLKELRCLYLQQNLISKLGNLEELSNLDTLNVSNNCINLIENISCLGKLNTLQISHNRLESFEDVEHLSECQSIGVLDLSNNRLKDPKITEIFSLMSNLHVLNLMGNPVAKEIKNYRKNVILSCKNLTYLDDRPVFPQERACTEAWARGGREAELAEKEFWVNKERRKIQESVDYLRSIRENARRNMLHSESKDEGIEILDISQETEVSESEEAEVNDEPTLPDLEDLSDSDEDDKDDIISATNNTTSANAGENRSDIFITSPSTLSSVQQRPLTADPIMQAYPKQMKQNITPAAVSNDNDNTLDSVTSQQKSMDETTTDFFTNLNKLATLSHHQVSSSHNEPKTDSNQEIPFITRSDTKPTNNMSSSVFSSVERTLEPNISSDLLFISNDEGDQEKNTPLDNDEDIETIELTNETKPSLIIEEIVTKKKEDGGFFIKEANDATRKMNEESELTAPSSQQKKKLLIQEIDGVDEDEVD